MASEKKSKKKLLIVILVLVIVALIGVIVYLLLSKKEPEQEDNDRGRAVVLTEDNVDEFMNEKVEDGYYLITMNTTWEFENGASESTNAYVANVKDNTRTVYFEVFLSDTEEQIYSSPYLPVGSEIKNFKLDKELAAGDYVAIVTYHLVDDEEKEIDKVSAEIAIHVQS